MVEAYVPYFLQMIGRMDDAHQICKVSKLNIMFSAVYFNYLTGN